MNTSPDEQKLALWLDDELSGEDLAVFEAGPGSLPEHQAAREEIRAYRSRLAAALPAAETPPFPDVFNRQILRAIEAEQEEPATTVLIHKKWNLVWMPLAACAGMVFAFFLGRNSTTTPVPPETVVDGAPRAIPVEAYVYTPDSGVDAEWFSSTGASATVIVLKGVEAIPDSVDFSKTASISIARESDSVVFWEDQDERGGTQ